jgi:hypothetical protein
LALFQVFQLVALAYVVVGVVTLVRVVRGWTALWDAELTDADVSLASRAAFFLLVPPTVALHELGHAVAVWLYGLEVVDWGFVGYMGWVLPSGSAGALGDFVVALAGNLVTLGLGLGALAFGIGRPGHPVRNLLAIELGRQSLFLVLVFYPLICVSFPGDFQRIYDFRATPIASGLTAAAHALLLGVGYLHYWKRRWRPRARLLCSPVAQILVGLEQRLAADPGDHEARRRLGALAQASGDAARAVELLEPAAAAGVLDARDRLVFGLALHERGRDAEAVDVLLGARDGLLDGQARRLAALTAARSALRAGRVDAAVALGETLRGEAPDDPRGLAVWAEALVAAGRGDEARRAVDAALEAAPEDRRQALRELHDRLR